MNQLGGLKCGHYIRRRLYALMASLGDLSARSQHSSPSKQILVNAFDEGNVLDLEWRRMAEPSNLWSYNDLHERCFTEKERERKKKREMCGRHGGGALLRKGRKKANW